MSFLGLLGRVAAGQAVRATIKGDGRQLQAGEVWITDYRDLLRELRKVDGAYAARLKRNMKRIAKPMQAGVKGTIPKKAPTSGIHKRDPKRVVSGFKPVIVPGRLSWGANFQNGNVRANNVLIQATKQKTWRKVGKFGKMSILRLAVDNAATVMADMAGASRQWINKKPRTRPYLYSRNGVVGLRQHRINNQGLGMISALNRGHKVQQGKASRWIWPTAEKYSEKTKMEIDAVLTEANRYLNERLKTR